MVVPTQTKTRMTATEFLALPETNQRMELINGELFSYGAVAMSPAPQLDHQKLVVKLIALLVAIAQDGEVFTAPTDVYMDDDNVVQPDVLWIAPQSQCVAEEGKHLRGAPDLIVEVLSPGTARQDKVGKFNLYEQHGVREYWIADPVHDLLEVWTLENRIFIRQGIYAQEDTFDSTALDEKTINLAAIF
jgi:Uma2 family endonuclease